MERFAPSLYKRKKNVFDESLKAGFFFIIIKFGIVWRDDLWVAHSIYNW